jgi:hypothetical protein
MQVSRARHARQNKTVRAERPCGSGRAGAAGSIPVRWRHSGV